VFVPTQAESSQERRLRSLVCAIYFWANFVSMLTCYPVLLQAMKEQPPPDAKCRDKFLVQSVAVTADKEFTNIGAIVRYTFVETSEAADRI
jgi:hypothetical protein